MHNLYIAFSNAFKERFVVTFLAIAFVFICLPMTKLYGQPSRDSQYYTFQKDSAAFVLMDPSKMKSANMGDVWVEDTSFGIPVGFPFRFLDHDLTHLRINQANLYLPERDYYITAFGNFIMGDRGDTISLSPITYIVDSSSGHKILKIQWLNAGFDFDTSMFINFQIWLYQGTNIIEIRYGKSHINLSKSQVHNCGPLVGLAKLDTVSNIELYEMDLSGKASKPRVVLLSDTGRRCLSNVPAEGTIYRFIYHNISGILPSYPLLRAFSVYPNPTSGKLNFNIPLQSSACVKVSDINGKELMKQIVDAKSTLDLAALPNGIYILNANIGEDNYFEKIVVCK